MTFSYKVKVYKCVGSCNDVEIPYFKVSVKVFDLISQENLLKISPFIKVVNVIVY